MRVSEPKYAASPRADLVIEFIDDDLVMLDKKHGQIHQLNHTASIVWKGIVAGEGLSTIINSIVDRFDVSAEAATQDVSRLVEQFDKLRLLESNP